MSAVRAGGALGARAKATKTGSARRAGAGPGAEILWEAQEVNDSLEVVFPRLVAGPGGEVSRAAPLAREALGAGLGQMSNPVGNQLA